MAHYTEFGYYRDEYEGSIEKEADFKKCRRIAESYIDQYTLNRIDRSGSCAWFKGLCL